MTRCLSWLSQYRMFFAPFLRDQVGQSPPRRKSDTVDLSLQEEEEPRMVPLSSFSAGLFAICPSPIIHLVCPPQCCISMVFDFGWDDCKQRLCKIWRDVQKTGSRYFERHYGSVWSGGAKTLLLLKHEHQY